MAEFFVGSTVTTTTPTVDVTISADKPLPIGRHRFRLVVQDDSGNLSAGDEVVIIVADQSAPTAVLKAPAVVASGASFTLDGSASFDVGGGKVGTWIWTYVGPAV
jgi:hypothetical protein